MKFTNRQIYLLYPTLMTMNAARTTPSLSRRLNKAVRLLTPEFLEIEQARMAIGREHGTAKASNQVTISAKKMPEFQAALDQLLNEDGADLDLPVFNVSELETAPGLAMSGDDWTALEPILQEG